MQRYSATERKESGKAIGNLRQKRCQHPINSSFNSLLSKKGRLKQKKTVQILRSFMDRENGYGSARFPEYSATVHQGDLKKTWQILWQKRGLMDTPTKCN
jgi:hypothetical protein